MKKEYILNKYASTEYKDASRQELENKSFEDIKALKFRTSTMKYMFVADNGVVYMGWCGTDLGCFWDVETTKESTDENVIDLIHKHTMSDIFEELEVVE